LRRDRQQKCAGGADSGDSVAVVIPNRTASTTTVRMHSGIVDEVRNLVIWRHSALNLQ